MRLPAVIVSLGFALLGLNSARAADVPASPIATIDFQRLVEEAPAHKAMVAALANYRKERGAELDNLQKERDKIFKELRDKRDKLKEEEKKALEQKAEQADSAAVKLYNEGRLHILRTQNRTRTQLEREVERLARAYAKEKGMAGVVDLVSPDARIILADPHAEVIDITDAIAERLEKFQVRPLEVFKPDPNDKEPRPQVLLKTNLGDIVVELDRAKAPVTVGNFLKYVEDKHFDGTLFHRVVGDFVIQGGGFTDRLKEKETRDPIPSESANGLKNDKGTIAMARLEDPDSASAQFYINLVDNAKLNYQDEDRPGYTVFGKVVKGIEVVEKIGAVKTAAKRGMTDVPVDPIIVKSAERIKK